MLNNSSILSPFAITILLNQINLEYREFARILAYSHNKFPKNHQLFYCVDG